MKKENLFNQYLKIPSDKLMITGIIIVVKGILSTNAEAIPDTHTIRRMATVNL